MKKGFLKKSVVGFELGILVLSLFAFSYMIYSLDVVRADYITDLVHGKGTSTSTGNVAKPSLLPTGGNIAAPTVAVETTTFQYAELSKLHSSGSTNFKILGRGSDGSYAMFDKVGGQNLGAIAEADLVNVDIGALEFADAPAPTSEGWLSSKLGLAAHGGMDALVSGLQWAGIAYMAGQLVGGLFGMTDENTDALSYGLGAGLGSYKALSTWSTTKDMWLGNPLVGAGIGAIVFVMMYKKVDVEVVNVGSPEERCVYTTIRQVLVFYA